jgi:hypothetical protein
MAARGAVHVVVVESGNSLRLVDVAEREGRPAQLVVFGVD